MLDSYFIINDKNVIKSLSFSPDVNECTANTDNCHDNAVCDNTIGSFTCTCNEGFTGDGVSCNGKYPV